MSNDDGEYGLNSTEAARLKQLEMRIGGLSDEELTEFAALRAKIDPNDPDRPVDEDQSEDIPEEVDYLKQLEDYFSEVEEQSGYEASKMARERIIASKQLELFIDTDAWNLELAQMETELNNKMIDQLERTQKQNDAIIARMNSHIDEMSAQLKRSAELNEKLANAYLAALDEDKVRADKLDSTMREIMELKRQKWIRENERA